MLIMIAGEVAEKVTQKGFNWINQPSNKGIY